MINKIQTEIKEKMVEVVIAISEYDYNNLMLYKDYPYGRDYAEQAIIKGILLPDNHGRLIDAHEQESIIEELENICINNEYVLDLLGKLKNASTILEGSVKE